MDGRCSDRPAQGPELTGFHRRCLDKRIGECDEALAQAVCALYEAEAWVPGDLSLHAMCELMRAARGLTELAHHISAEGTQVSSSGRPGAAS